MRQAAGDRQMRSLWLDLDGEDTAEDIWPIVTPNKKEKLAGKYPTKKPVALLERIILASTLEGDTVLDPFTGSSTTALAALKTNRPFIGIDNNEEYLKLSIKRLMASN